MPEDSAVNHPHLSALQIAFDELAMLCGAAVPAGYNDLLADYPDCLRTALRSENGDFCEGTVADVELLASPDLVVAVNREVRSYSVPDPSGREFRWPESLLVIGETGDGDYYCIDTDPDYSDVLQFRHQPVEFEVIADSLSEFVDLLIRAYCRS